MVPIIPPDDPGDHGRSTGIEVEVDTDALETLVTTTNTLLQEIENNTDGIEAALAPSERKVDGDGVSGVDTIIIPDGVFSWALTVSAIGSGVTIDGPDFSNGPVSLFAGQSIGHSADGKNNTLNGPITITTTADSIVNATWVKA